MSVLKNELKDNCENFVFFEYEGKGVELRLL